MSFKFLIQPIGLDAGFELSCEGILPDAIHHQRLIDAVIHAVQIGYHLDGQIHVFDSEGQLAEILPIRWEEKSRLPELLAAA
jgi:hypothetical protein